MKTRIYDLPTRMFHWLFAGSFLTAFTIAKVVDDESAVFSLHMLAGLIMGFTVILRIVWSFVGSKHARFSDFSLQPRQLLAYLKAVVTGQKVIWAGHNPASSWAAIAMMGLAAGLTLTGILMAADIRAEFLEDVHEFMADAFIFVVIAHIAGVVLHSMQYRDQLAKSMVTGVKSGLAESTAAVPAYKLAGVIFLLLTLSFGSYLWQNYQQNTGTLSLFGIQLQLQSIEQDKHETSVHEDD